MNGVGVSSCRICQGTRFAEIVADPEAIAAKVLIVLNPPRQAADLNLVSAGSGKDKHIRLLIRRLYGFRNPGFLPNFPARNGRAGHRVPCCVVSALLFHHGKKRAVQQLIVRNRNNLLTFLNCDAIRQNQRFGQGVDAGRPWIFRQHHNNVVIVPYIKLLQIQFNIARTRLAVTFRYVRLF